MRRVCTAMAAVAFVVGAPPVHAAEDDTAAPLVREAGSFALYHENAQRMGGDGFNSIASLDDAIAAVGAQDPYELGRSWVAYAALHASRSTPFRDAVREVADYYGHEAIVNGLQANVAYASQIGGADDARGYVLARVAADVAELRAGAQAVKQEAFALQSARWAQRNAGDRTTRVARLERDVAPVQAVAVAHMAQPVAAQRAVATAPLTAAEREAVAAVWRLYDADTALSETARAVAVREAAPRPRHQHALDRALTLAALDALGAASSQHASAWNGLLDAAPMDRCLTRARLNMGQCIAATRFRWEDPYCLAEHALNEVGDCLAGFVGE